MTEEVLAAIEALNAAVQALARARRETDDREAEQTLANSMGAVRRVERTLTVLAQEYVEA